MATTKWILIFFLIMSSSILSFAQTELTGSMGLTFGTKSLTVKNIMEQRGGKVTSGKYSTLIITGITMGSKKPDMVICRFVNDKLFTIEIYFVPSVEAKTQELYDEINDIIVSKYGKGQSYRNFKGVYSDGDGYEIQAVKTGNASIVSFWTFLNDNMISLEIYPISDDVFVKLSYQDGKLAAEAEKLQADKNKTEF